MTLMKNVNGENIPLTAEEEAEYNARQTTWDSPQARAERIIPAIQSAVQGRLDAFAQTRRYDGILSACTYATSTVPQFRADGQYCVQVRDATWAKCTEILAAVQAGTRPLPGGYSDIEAELPVLEWPL